MAARPPARASQPQLAPLLLSPATALAKPRSGKKVKAEWTAEMEGQAAAFYLQNYIGGRGRLEGL